MTVTMPHHTLISDAEIQMLRQLVEAADLTLANEDAASARRNIQALARQLGALAKGDTMHAETLCYGTVSLREVRLLGMDQGLGEGMT